MFVTGAGEPVIDIVFLCRYMGGTPVIAEAGEIADIMWLTAPEILAYPSTPPWIRRSVELAERKRLTTPA